MISLAQASFPCPGSHSQIWALLLCLTPPPLEGELGPVRREQTDLWPERDQAKGFHHLGLGGVRLSGCFPPLSYLLIIALLSLQPNRILRWKIEGEK